MRIGFTKIFIFVFIFAVVFSVAAADVYAAQTIHIQRGTADVPVAGTTQTSATNFTEFGSLTSAFVLNKNNHFGSAGRSTLYSTDVFADDVSLRIELTATDTITFTRMAGSDNADYRADWESWEYMGAPGGPNEFIVRSRNTITITAGNRTATEALDNTPVDIDKCIPFITGISNTLADTSTAQNLTAVAWISGANTLNVERGGNTGTTVVQIVTVEFTGSNWRVAHARSADFNGDTGTVTLYSDADGQTNAFTINDTANAFIASSQFKGDDSPGNSGVSDTYPETYISSTTQVTYNFHSQHDAVDNQVFVHVLENAECYVTRYQDSQQSAGDNNIDITSAGVKDLTNTSIFATRQTGGTASAYPKGWTNYRITSTTNAALWCTRQDNTMSSRIEIVKMPGSALYRSVGNETSDLNAATGANVTITGNIAQFDTDLFGNIGVGDVLQYQVAATYYAAFISGRTDANTFRVQSSTGGTPQATSGSVAVEIYRAHLELNDWEQQLLAGVNPSIHADVDDDVLVNTTLSSIMAVACYAAATVDNAAVTISGWTTTAANYIKIYTPYLSSEVGTSQRHNGVWDTGAYSLEVGGDSVLDIREENVRVDGLQVRLTTDTYLAVGIEMRDTSGTGDYKVSNCIIRGNGVGTQDIRIGINLWGHTGTGVLKAWNNIIYDWNGSGSGNYVSGIVPDDSGYTFYLYNNTVVDCEVGIENSGGTVILKNNIVHSSFINDGDYMGTFDASSTHNLGEESTGPSGGSNYTQTTQTAAQMFVDPTNDNFHIKSTSDAHDAGTDQVSEIGFTDDIDGGARSGTWDIGADENGAGPAAINYRSIGTDNGTLFNSGTASINFGSTTVTFTSDLSDPASVGAVGQGDKLVLGGETFYILSRDSATQVTVQTAATGNRSGTPTITRAYNAIQTWENDRDGDLVSENRIEVGVCYKDGNFQETVTINSSTTDADHYMHLTVAEGQRHNGTWGTGANLVPQNFNEDGVNIQDPYTVVEWLEIYGLTAGGSQSEGIHTNSAGGNNALIQNLIVRNFGGAGIITLASSTQIRNCLVVSSSDDGIRLSTAGQTVYNCTVINSTANGVNAYYSGSHTVENVIAMLSGGNDFNEIGAGGDFATINNCMSEDGTADDYGGSNHQASKVYADQFVSTSNPFDFHLKTGSDAINAGKDLSSSFSGDIDGEIRSETWDIGADEADACINSYAYRRLLTIDAAQVEAPGASGSLSNFPVMVSLSGDWLRTTTADPTNGKIENANGWDIIFKDSTGATQLDHEIEYYDGSGSGQAVALLDDWTRPDTGTNVPCDQATECNYAPSAGSDRLLVFAFHFETSGADAPITVTWGGVSMTQAATYTHDFGDGWWWRSQIFYLAEKDWPGGGPYDFRVYDNGSGEAHAHVATFSGVNQLNPIVDTATGTCDECGPPHEVTSSSFNVEEDGMAIALGVVSAFSDDNDWTGNTPDWNEGVDISTAGFSSAGANTTSTYASSGTDTVTVKAQSLETQIVTVVSLRPASAGDLVAWVKIPSLSESSNTDFYMYYGSSCVVYNTQNPEAVWDTTDGWRAVWHMKETPGVDSYAYDSTSEDNDGTFMTMASDDQVPGKIDGSLDFEGGSDYLDLPDAKLQAVNTITISCWVKPDVDTNERAIYGAGVQYSAAQGVLLQLNDGNSVGFDTGRGGTPPGDYDVMASSGTISTKNWAHIAATWDGADKYIYINGLQDSSTVSFSGTIDYKGNNTFIGLGYPTERFWDGKIDECRVSNEARDAEWIETEYNNQSSTANFYSVGSEGDAPTTRTVYRSVGTAVSSIESGSGNALTISGSIATFGSGLSNNVGVGDAIEYDSTGDTNIDAIAFIHDRTDSQTFTVINKNGGTPIAVAGDNDWAIYRAYDSLVNWNLRDENDLLDDNVEEFNDNSDLTEATGNNTIMMVACYADGVDSTAVTINGWTTSADNYIKIYTPTATSEVGATQRHSGAWDDSKYRIETSGRVIDVFEENIRIEGLQIKQTAVSSNGDSGIIYNGSGVSDLRISHNIIQGVASSSIWHCGIEVYSGAAGSVARVWNNIVYNFTDNTYGQGIYFTDGDFTAYVYNNIAYNNGNAYYSDGGDMVIAKNNIAFNNGDDYNGMDSASDNNLGEDAAFAGDTNYVQTSQTAAQVFVDPGGSPPDFHILSTSDAYDAGADLSSDANLAFSDDIDGETRPLGSQWDIGADEYIAGGNSAPTAPTTAYSNNTSAQSGQTNPTGITDSTPAFSAIYADPDSGDTANKYRIQVDDANDFVTTLWDTGASGTSMTDTDEGNRSPDIIYAGSALSNSTTYYWRIKFWDDDNTEGAWSTNQQFTTGTLGSDYLEQLHYRWRNDNGGEGGGLDVGDDADGAISLAADFNMNTTALGGRTYPDGVAYRVKDIVSADITLGNAAGQTLANTNGIAAGDEILLINLQGSSGDNGDVGNYEFLEVSSVSGGVVTVSAAPSNTYDGSGDSYTTQKVFVQRVPNYTNVTTNGYKITAGGWDGGSDHDDSSCTDNQYTGIVVLRASGTVTVSAGGSIDVDELGYRGAPQHTGADPCSGYGYQGEGYTGGYLNYGNGANAEGGGGGNIDPDNGGGGGGGGFGTAGATGTVSQGTGPAGVGGGTYGVAALTQLFSGSGGGSGGKDATTCSRIGHAGGDAGGIIFVIADIITVSGSVTANGAFGEDGDASRGDAGGGGAGGSIKFLANNATLGASLVTATGGAGGTSGDGNVYSGDGGDGGDGRIRVEVDLVNLSGSTDPGYDRGDTPSSGSGATWAADQDTKLTNLAKNTIKRLRFLVDNSGAQSSGAVSYQLQVLESATCASGGYSAVSGTDWEIVDSGLTDGAATTNVPSGLDDPGASSFTPGEQEESSNTTDAITIGALEFTEIEFSLQATASATAGGDYCFKLVKSGSGDLDNYAQYAEVGVINQTPTAPTTPYCDDDAAQSGQTNPSGITDATPAFSAIYNDPDSGDIANKYRVEVNTQSDFNGTVMWDSGAGGTSMTDTTEGSRSPDITYAGAALASNTQYFWRITFWDDDNTEGTVSATQNFTMGTVNAAYLDQLHYRWRNDNGGEGGGLDVGDDADGAMSLAADSNMNTTALGGRTYPDGVAYRVKDIVSADITLGNAAGQTLANTNGIAAGDEILLINLQGSSGDNSDVGNYEFLEVASVSGGVVTVDTAPSNTYDGSGDSYTTQKVFVQRVPNYTNVTTNGYKISAGDWDGGSDHDDSSCTDNQYTGIVVLRASGTVTVSAGGSIDVDELGYRGAPQHTGADPCSGYGYQGEGYTGGYLNYGNGANAEGGGGGYVNPDNQGGGGGGGFGSAGATGTVSQGTGPAGVGGGTYGVAALTQLFSGSGGGSGGKDATTCSRIGHAGGDAGGMIFIIADTITVSGSISANGAVGEDGDAARGDAGGGGAGGSIKFLANNATLGASLVTATGGTGGASGGSYSGAGGDGGDGRIRIEVDLANLSGSTDPAYDRGDTPGGSGASWAADQDTQLTDLPKMTIKRLRFLVDNSGGLSSGAVAYELQVDETATCSSGSYSAVAGTHWEIVDSGLTDGAATSNVPSGLDDPGASSFTPGEQEESSNTTDAITLASLEFTEIEFSLRATANATAGGDYCFKLVKSGVGDLANYAQYAAVSIEAGANQTPDDPTINDHNDSSTISDNTPILGFTQSDPDASEQVKYRIQIDDTDNNFSSLVVDYTSALMAEGAASFTVGQAEGSGTYTVGSESQTLTDGDYFWRVMTTDDQSAASGWTQATSGSTVAFTVDTSSSCSTVDLSDSWSQGEGAYTVPTSGSNRLLVFVACTEQDPDADVTDVDFGAAQMIQGPEHSYNGNAAYSRCEIWYLKEADIPAGSNSFSVTYSTAPFDKQHARVTFENVNQVMPFVDNTGNEYAQDTDGVLSVNSFNVEQGGRTIAAAVNGVQAGSWGWSGGSGWATGLDSDGVLPSIRMAVTHSTDTYSSSGNDSVTATYTPGTLNDQVLVVASLRPACTNTLYRSVGNDSADLNAVTGANVTITGTTAQFDTDLDGEIGIGDVLQYQVAATYYVAFISGRTDANTFTVLSSTGGTPQATGGSVTVNIYRAHLELNDWEQQLLAGVNPSIHADVDDDVLVNTTLSSIMAVACYAAATVDDAAVTISGWTTSADNYIKIYTPTSSSEVGTSQRHSGVWDDDKYSIEADPAGSPDGVITIHEDFVRVEGLQIEAQGSAEQHGIWGDISQINATSDIRVSYNIVRGAAGLGEYSAGIAMFTNGTGNAITARIWNNIVYDFVNGASDLRGITGTYNGNATLYIYNNTVYNCRFGFITENDGTLIAKNNIAIDNNMDYYEYNRNFDSASNYNLGQDGGPTNDSNYVQTTQTAAQMFVDPASDNFHILSTSDAFNAGTDQVSEIGFTDDIDGDTRSGAWDIGADEASIITNIYTIGTFAADVDITSVSGSGPWTIQLAAADLSSVAVYDELTDEAATPNSWKITAVDDGADTLTVIDSESNGGSPSDAGSSQATVSRWYTTMQLWEDARDGNLTTRNAIEKGLAYNDSKFTAGVDFQGSTTDADRYMWLAAADGERHTGVAGTGVEIEHTGGAGFGIIKINDDYTRIEGIEIDWDNNGSAIINVGEATDNDGSILDGLILHGGGPGVWIEHAGVTLTMQNLIFYEMDDRAIYNEGGASGLKLYNSTIVGNGDTQDYNGLDGPLEAYNVIVVNSDPQALDFDGSVTGDYNISSDNSAPGANSLKGRTETDDPRPAAGSDWVVFANLTSGSEDLHLQYVNENDAINAGDSTGLTDIFTNDIDGETRSGTWDIGADEVDESCSNSYAYRRLITVDAAQVEAPGVDGSLSNFPVLVNLSSPWLRTTAADATNGRIEHYQGWDIVFRDSTGLNQLDHEIEYYDGSATVGEVTRLDTSWHTGLTGYTVPAGSNRALVFVTALKHPSDDAPAITGVTYGGQDLQKAIGYKQTATSPNRMFGIDIWYLNEAGIQAASGSDFVVSYSVAPSASFHSAATFANVDQISPIGDSASRGDTSDNPIEATVDVLEGWMSVAGVANWYYDAGDDYTWGNGWGKTSEQDQGGVMLTMSTAEHAATADGTDTASATYRTTQILTVISLRPSPALIAWVKIPNLSESSNTDFYMYYGNACIANNTENPEAVWDTNDGWRAVWHMKETPGAEAYVYDSTSNSVDLDFKADMTSDDQVSGQIDGSLDFDGGANDSIRKDEDSPYLGGMSNLTVETWVKLKQLADNHYFMQYKAHSGPPDFSWQFMVHNGTPDQFYLEVRTDGTVSSGSVKATTSIETDTWYHVVGVYQSGQPLKLYVNGSDVSTSAATPDGSIIDSDSWFAMGSDNDLFVLDEARVSSSLSVLEPEWIETSFNNQSAYGSFLAAGGEETDPVTAVSLASFTATGSGNDVRVDWLTGHEINNLGFNVYRATQKGGPYQKINSGMIPGLNYSALGKAYSYLDTAVTPGTLYYYKLEDIDVYGKHTYHGPVCVDWDADGMPDDWEIRYGLNPWVNDADIDSDGDGLTNLQEYELGFDPFNPDTDGDGILDGDEAGMVSAPDTDGSRVLTRGVEVLAEDQSGITLELLTESFFTETADVDGQEFERLRIEEYIHGYTAAIGQPLMPQKGILIDLPDGMAGALSILETEVTTHSGYQIFPVPEAIVDAQGATAAVAESFIQDQDAYQQDAFYPQDVAGLASIYTFRDQQKQQLLFYPLSFNPSSGDLRHYRRIRLRIDFVDNHLALATDINPTLWKVPAEQGLSEQLASMGTMAMAFGASPLIVNPLSPALSSLGVILSAVWTPPADAGADAYKILTSEAGIYRIYRADLALDDDLSAIRLYNLGTEVAIYIYDQNSNDYLDAGDYIEFYAEPVAAAYSKYAKYNVYWLVTSSGIGSPKRMLAVNGDPSGGGALATEHSFLQHTEQDAQYRGDAPGADSLDRWYYSQYVLGTGFTGGLGPFAANFSVPVFDNQAAGSLRISLWGYADTDHDLEVWVNGVYQDTFYWSGITYNEVVIDNVDVKDSVVDQTAQAGDASTITLAAAASAVDDIYNEMLIEITAGEGAGQVRKIIDYNGTTKVATVENNFGPDPNATSVYRIDTAVALVCDSGDDAFLVDWFELTYDRNFSAVANSLQFAHDSGYRYVVDNFSTNDLLVFDISEPTDVAYVENAVIAGSDPYSIEFEPPTNPGASETYLIISAADYKSPVSISEDVSSDLADTDNEVDYILITHQDIGWDGGGDPYGWLDDLVALREDGGLTVKTVDVADIYDEFSYGLTSPVAIRDFLAYAYGNWQSPAPQYVLLVGDGSFDYKDNLNIGTTNYVPGYMKVTDYAGEAITDEYFVKISGDDAIPDMYIGRLPAESEAQAGYMVAKIKHYEETVHSKAWRQNVLLVADDQNEPYEAVFELMNEDAMALLPSKMVPLTGYLEYSTPAAINSFIDTTIGAGALIVNYSGHGGLDRWAAPSIFEDVHVADLDNNGKYPFVIGMSCLSGNFGFVSKSQGTKPSLAEKLLQAEAEGAVAALMPTGMTTTAGQYILNTALFEAFFTDDIRQLGPAILSAKQTLLANGSAEYEQISETFLLFGDPALGLKIPLPRMPSGVAAYQESNGVRIRWNAALDSNGNAVAGYHVYRSTSPAGPYVRIDTALITGTEFVDTSTGLGADAGGGGGYYYGVSSEDSDGDESVQSLGVSPAALASSASEAVACFIGSVAQAMPHKGLWMLAVLTAAVLISKWYMVYGSRLKAQGSRHRAQGGKKSAEGIAQSAKGKIYE